LIVDEGGQYKSVLTKEEIESRLQEDIENLTPEELHVLQIIISEKLGVAEAELEVGFEAGEGPKQHSVLDVLNNAEYKHKPVDLETFVKDPYYLGETCKNIYPAVLEALTHIFNGGFSEVILTGSIGWGKSYCASVGLCRILYEISCMKDPHGTFGLEKNTNISIVCLSVSEELAIKVAFEYVASRIEVSPYFKDQFPYKKKKKQVEFPGSVWLAARSSSDNSVLGLNVIAGMLDETNFLAKPVKSVKNRPGQPMYDHAQSLYDAIMRRMKTRFQQRGKLPGVLFLSSSKQTDDDFTARKINESKHDSSIYVADYAVWEAKPKDYEHSKWFYVLCGSAAVRSRILEEDEDIEELEGQLPEGACVVRVPEEYRPDFESNLEGSIRDLAGRATSAITPYVQRREKILSSFPEHGDRKHPFSVMVYDMSKPGDFIWPLLIREVEIRLPGGKKKKKLQPIVNPKAMRHVHMDPSLSGDCSGFTMSHICGWKDVLRRNDLGEQHIERAPVYWIDLMLQIIPPIGGEIILGDVRRLIYALSARNFIIGMVTQDAYQHGDSLQKLRAKGYKAELLSVDTSIDPYDTFKVAMYEGRVLGYYYPPIINELRKLEKDNKRNKVDHPPGGSKDVSDSAAGSIFTLSETSTSMPLPIMTGAQSVDSVPIAAGQPSVVDSQGVPLVTTSTGLPPFMVGSMFDDWGGFGGGWDPGSL
jgi:hypothetical protein